MGSAETKKKRESASQIIWALILILKEPKLRRLMNIGNPMKRSNRINYYIYRYLS